MIRIRVHCPECGDVVLEAGEVNLRVAADLGGASTDYCFLCPGCRTAVHRPLLPRFEAMLVAAGCPVVEWSLTGDHPIDATEGCLTLADIAAFSAQLDSDQWPDEVVPRG